MGKCPPLYFRTDSAFIIIKSRKTLHDLCEEENFMLSFLIPKESIPLFIVMAWLIVIKSKNHNYHSTRFMVNPIFHNKCSMSKLTVL